jgi:hypothetical protein
MQPSAQPQAAIAAATTPATASASAARAFPATATAQPASAFTTAAELLQCTCWKPCPLLELCSRRMPQADVCERGHPGGC